MRAGGAGLAAGRGWTGRETPARRGRPRLRTLFTLTATFGLPLGLSAQMSPEVSEIDGDRDAEEGEGLDFGVGVFNPTGETLTFTWDLGDGSPSVEGVRREAVTHRYRQDGEYTVTLDVSGSEGFSASRTFEVGIRNARPRVHVISGPRVAVPDEPVRFRGVAWDPGDDDLTYMWDFGDGSAAQEGLELRDADHAYTVPGRYTLTLTVRDEDGLEGRETLEVFVTSGFLGTLSGPVELEIDGTTGKPALFNAMGPSPLFSGAIPMRGGIADLSDHSGACLVAAGFWDDASKVHVNFVWTPASEGILDPKAYPVVYEQSGEGLNPDQVVVNALVLGIDPTYEETKAGSQQERVFQFDLESILEGMGGGLVGRLLGRRGPTPGGNPGQNWQLTSLERGGVLTVTRVTDRHIMGFMDVQLHGAYVSQIPPESSPADGVRLQGGFAWSFDEVARFNLQACGERPFGIQSHTPTTEETRVDFRLPEISITFTDDFVPETVNVATFQVGYLDPSNAFEQIPGEIVHDIDGRTVRFQPDEDLLDAVYYHVRIAGGESGVTGVAGQTLPEDYEWRFSTVVDLLPRRR